ncbi:MAG: hypothetical protein NTU73_14195 [Ignavibacteriae bacterium]|nr:hypothetical protein [Ignavibacteriota bacterium]
MNKLISFLLICIYIFISFYYAISDDREKVEMNCNSNPWGFTNVNTITMSPKPFILADLKNTRLYSWEEVIDLNSSNDSKKYTFFYKVIEETVDLNLFNLTTAKYLDPYNKYQMKLLLSDGFQEMLNQPTLYVFRLFLLKDEFKRNKNYFIENITKHLLSNESKKLWEENKTKYIKINGTKVLYDDEKSKNEGYVTYNDSINNLTYYKALRKTVDYVISIIDSTDFNKKVLPYKDDVGGYAAYFGARLWMIVEEKNKIYDFIGDDAPYRMSLILYRLGEKASKDIRENLLIFKDKIPNK